MIRTRLAIVLTVLLTICAGVYALPPDGDSATQALVSSPRHGEWVEIQLPGSDTPLRSWVVYPERPDAAPVVVVIHEIFGLTDWIRGVADALAAEGYIAVAPDLLSGKGPNGGGTESFEGDAVRAAIQKLSVEEVNARLDAARQWAIDLPASSDRSAVVGFCWGGTASFNYAIHQPALNAAIVYYGTGPSDAAKIAPIKAPVLGFYGGDDARVTSTVPATLEAMTQAEKTFLPHTYDGAGHGFLRQQTGRDGANKKAAEQAWDATLHFLKQHLAGE